MKNGSLNFLFLCPTPNNHSPMWKRLGRFILIYRIPLLALMLGITAFMGYKASSLELGYEFANAIPTNHPKYKAYQEFREKFGEDGNLLVIGIQTGDLFKKEIFSDYQALSRNISKEKSVEDVIGLPSAIDLVRDPESESLNSVYVFPDTVWSQGALDSCRTLFYSLPFYRDLLYNPATNAWLMGVRINKEVLSSKKREKVVAEIEDLAYAFGARHGIDVHLSGLPLIRTVLAKRIANEMRWFLLASAILSAVILFLFFRSFSATLLSLAVVGIGVVWSLGTMVLIGYKITLLTALIPPLIVVIGIPNCIYFLNKFHVSWNASGNKKESLVSMVERMGIITLFCNITAGIGFAVFALTRSQVLREFGAVAGINIFMLFIISLILIPAVLAFLPDPKTRHTKYLSNPGLNRWLTRLERWSLNHRKLIYGVAIMVVMLSIAGMFRLRSEGFIVDDLPKSDKIYTDLKFFERHFNGVMPLEILVDTKKKRGISRSLSNLLKIDSLSAFMDSMPEIGKPLNITEGMKFARQAFFEGDPVSYAAPTEFDMIPMKPYLEFKSGTGKEGNTFTRLVSSFIDSNKQEARISVNMKDVGSYRLPGIVDSIQQRADQLFDKDKYHVQLTGASITFLEGSRFIINGLKESILWAFALIALCMLYLFRSWRILFCSLIPNLIPLVITAGVMGWLGVRIKPSTVLIFSVALGIAIDVTIRFLVNYKQELPRLHFDMKRTVIQTIHSTGISILYTSMVLIAGFVIFCFSSFGGTQSLGWLTSLTLVTATVTNLVLLPALLITFISKK